MHKKKKKVAIDTYYYKEGFKWDEWYKGHKTTKTQWTIVYVITSAVISCVLILLTL